MTCVLILQVVQKTVSQIDLVPTVSLLLGLPIPYSSLGTVVLDLFSHYPWWPSKVSRIRQVYHVVKALRVNANQVSMLFWLISSRSAVLIRKLVWKSFVSCRIDLGQSSKSSFFAGTRVHHDL